MEKVDLLKRMSGCNSKQDKNRTIMLGLFCIDYSHEEDKFFLTYPAGAVKEITFETAKKYIVGEEK